LNFTLKIYFQLGVIKLNPICAVILDAWRGRKVEIFREGKQR
jgi:hypothetical protein